MARIQTPAHLQREFECVYLIRQDVDDPSVDKIVSRFRGVVEDNGGKVVHLESWGKRKLAYPINKQRTAHYIHMGFFGSQDLVAEVERTMRLSDDVVRFLTVLCERAVDPESKQVAGELQRRQEQETESESRFAGSSQPKEVSGYSDDDDDDDDRFEAQS